LVELLIYIGVFAILAVIFSGILVTFTRVNVDQVARGEVAAQLNFAFQTIQRFVSDASAVLAVSAIEDTDLGVSWDEADINLGAPQKYLVVKLPADDNSSNSITTPAIIYEENGRVIIRRGRGAANHSKDAVTTDKVRVDKLTFTKFINYPGRDIVEINLTMSFNSEKPIEKISRRLVLGVGKAYAATFDTDLLPGTDAGPSIGQGTKKWLDAFFAGNLTVDGNASLKTANIGSSGTIINGLFNGSITVDPPSIAAGGNGTIKIAAPTAIDASDRVFLTPPANLEAGLILVGARTINDTDEIEITLRNTSSSVINGASRNWYYLIIK